VLWDGRDDKGGEAGTGVYCYRLRAGASIEIRKGLLLR